MKPITFKVVLIFIQLELRLKMAKKKKKTLVNKMLKWNSNLQSSAHILGHKFILIWQTNGKYDMKRSKLMIYS